MTLICIRNCPACDIAKSRWPFLNWRYPTIEELEKSGSVYPMLLDDKGIYHSGIGEIECQLQLTM